MINFIGNKSDKWVLIGASRGLGKAFSEQLKSEAIIATNLSRTAPPPFQFDASKEETWPDTIQKLRELSSKHLVYFAGGGPHGNFGTKNWRDHEWSWRVNFGFPAFLLHQILHQPDQWPNLRQICFIGSSIAEEWPDAGAASYASGKHALRGLVTSLQAEIGRNDRRVDLRLFSPGYMDTALLPENAWPRQEPGRVQDPKIIAEKLLNWLVLEEERMKHKVLL